MAEITLTAANFEAEVLQSDVPVLVDFWATWCGPCQMVAPIVAAIAEENAGKLKVGKVNVDEEPVLANAFQVQVIPTLVAFKNGQVVGVLKGLRDKADILAMFQ